MRLLLVIHRPGLQLRVLRHLVLRRRLVYLLLVLGRLLLRRVVALRKGVAAVAEVVLRVVDLRWEVARHAVVVVRRVGVVLVVDEAAPARPVTRSVAKQPNAKTISKIRRFSYAFTVKGEFPDVAHRDGSFRFTEYAYAVGTSQPGVPRTIQEARAMPDAAEWEAAANR